MSNPLNLEHLYGIHELKEIKTYVNGVQTKDKAKSGMFVFTRDHRLSVVSGSDEMVIAYTGTFEVKESTLFIRAESCSIREWEGVTIAREIIKLDPDSVIFGVASPDGSMRSELSWKKKISL